MKKIIDGKLYDSDKAEQLALSTNKYPPGNSYFEAEMLYRSPQGQLFIYGHGGPLSGYGITKGNTHYGGEELWLVTEEEAKEFCIENNLTSAVLELFPDSIEEG